MNTKIKVLIFVLIVGAIGYGGYKYSQSTKTQDPLEALREVLRDPKSKEMQKVGALLQLATREDEFAKQKAIEFLATNKESLKVPCIRALSFYQDEASTQALMQELKKSSSGSVKDFALKALGYRANNFRAFELENFIKENTNQLTIKEKILANSSLHNASLDPEVKNKVVESLLGMFDPNSNDEASILLKSTLQQLAPGDPRIARLSYEEKKKNQKDSSQEK